MRKHYESVWATTAKGSIIPGSQPMDYMVAVLGGDSKYVIVKTIERRRIRMSVQTFYRNLKRQRAAGAPDVTYRVEHVGAKLCIHGKLYCNIKWKGFKKRTLEPFTPLFQKIKTQR